VELIGPRRALRVGMAFAGAAAGYPAVMPRLHRVTAAMPGIARRRRGRGFSYEDARGRSVNDEHTVERIRSLAIPPAWNDVWICPDPAGHLQAVGTDAAGRRQYLYHEAWRTRRDVQKFRRIERFAERLPELRSACNASLRERRLTRDKVLATAIRLLDEGSFRIGSESYARDNGTYGLATLRREHVSVEGDRITFDFTAKSGKRHVQTIVEPRLARTVRALKQRRGGGGDVLAYREEGRWIDIRSSDINDALHEMAGEDFSAKDFRTWQATVLAAVLLAVKDHELTADSSRRRGVTAVVRDVAEHLGNTPAVCRASYIDPRVIDAFLEGSTIARTIRGIDLDTPFDLPVRQRIEQAVLDLVQGSVPAAA
jgi:DNA topoisomerase-1